MTGWSQGGTQQSQNESETPLMVRLESRFESLPVTWHS